MNITIKDDALYLPDNPTPAALISDNTTCKFCNGVKKCAVIDSSEWEYEGVAICSGCLKSISEILIKL